MKERIRGWLLAAALAGLLSFIVGPALVAAQGDYGNDGSPPLLPGERRIAALPTVFLNNVFARGGAEAFTWTLQIAASTAGVRVPAGNGAGQGSVNFQAAVTRQVNPSALTLTGNIQINNPNGFALVLSDVQVELRRTNGQNLILPATCNGVRIPRNSVLNCNFLFALPGTESGAVLARATFNQQYAFSGTVDNTIQSQQLPYNFNNGAQLGCATITSSFSGQFQPQLQGNVPTGQICDSQQFSWSALYGPFSDTQCGNYQSTNQLSVQPIGGSPATRTTTIQLVVDGCPPPPGQTAVVVPSQPQFNFQGNTQQPQQPGQLSFGVLNIVANAPSGFTWAVRKEVSAGSLQVTANGRDTGRATYRLTHTRSGTGGAFTIVGTVAFGNPNPQPVPITRVELDVVRGGQPAGTLTLQCGGNEVPAADPTTRAPGALGCPFAASFGDGASGSVTPRALLGSTGQQVVGSATPFAFEAGGGNGGECAVVTDNFEFSGSASNSIVSGNKPTSDIEGGTRVCETGTFTYTVQFGPFQRAACGKTISVANVAKLNPLESGQQTLQSAADLELEVECP